jgi:hypothetical protein
MHYLYLQDVRYCLKKVEWMRQIAEQHPDKHEYQNEKQRVKQLKRFRRLLQYYRWWEARMVHEYKQLGPTVTPPNWKDVKKRLGLQLEDSGVPDESN